jgi:predicted anti-sigma-YlaC factor YlaD
MKQCEYHESQISSWMDDELERPEQIELVDHLARCESCRRYYLDARSLDGLLAVVRTPEGEETPDRAIWNRIEAETASPAVSFARRRRVPAWALQAAALIVIAVGLGIAAWTGGMPEGQVRDQIEIRIGEDSGVMTDERFVELATEVMRADRRYRSAMLEVMEQVESDTRTGEGSVEEILPRFEDEETNETVTVSRIPA